MSKFYSAEYAPTDEDIQKMRDGGHIRPSFLKRLPVIRHIRAMVTCYKINQHYHQWAQLGMIAWNARFEYTVCHAIWHNLLPSPTPSKEG